MAISRNQNVECGVYVNANVYGIKVPYKNCQIICEPEKANGLLVMVFSGTYEECEEFIKENCECK